jgi:glutathione S-transferase
MSTPLTLPANYGVAALAAGPFAWFVSTFMGGKVMAARKQFDVQYPNLYAVPGVHEKADDFNRVQRGHQAIFEVLGSVQVMTLYGGLEFPIVASTGCFLFLAGSWAYLVGYSDTSLDVKGARYKGAYHLGVLKPIGMLTCLVASIATSGKHLGWW